MVIDEPKTPFVRLGMTESTHLCRVVLCRYRRRAIRQSTRVASSSARVPIITTSSIAFHCIKDRIRKMERKEKEKKSTC